MIYQPDGAALEYGRMAVNHYIGCPHGCVYCYARRINQKVEGRFPFAAPRLPSMGEFAPCDAREATPEHQDAIVTTVRRDAQMLVRRGYSGEVFLCFMADPWPAIDNEIKLTRRVISAITGAGLPVMTLTKAGRHSFDDIPILVDGDRENWYGVTITTMDEEKVAATEPHAAPVMDRVEGLTLAHMQKIKTFVSIEPMASVDETLEIISKTWRFVDEYRVGVMSGEMRDRVGVDPRDVDAIKETVAQAGRRLMIKNSLAVQRQFLLEVG